MRENWANEMDRETTDGSAKSSKTTYNVKLADCRVHYDNVYDDDDDIDDDRECFD